MIATTSVMTTRFGRRNNNEVGNRFFPARNSFVTDRNDDFFFVIVFILGDEFRLVLVLFRVGRSIRRVIFAGIRFHGGVRSTGFAATTTTTTTTWPSIFDRFFLVVFRDFCLSDLFFFLLEFEFFGGFRFFVILF